MLPGMIHIEFALGFGDNGLHWVVGKRIEQQSERHAVGVANRISKDWLGNIDYYKRILRVLG